MESTMNYLNTALMTVKRLPIAARYTLAPFDSDTHDYSVVDTHNGNLVLKTNSLSYALMMRNALNANRAPAGR